MNIDTMRLQLIESATTRPTDLIDFYNKHSHRDSNGCSFLDGTTKVELLFRGHLRRYDAAIVPFALAGVNPNRRKSCGHHDCINPDHAR